MPLDKVVMTMHASNDTGPGNMGDSVGNISQQDKGIRDVGSYIFLWAACFILTYTFPLLNQMLKASGTFGLYGLFVFWDLSLLIRGSGKPGENRLNRLNMNSRVKAEAVS